MREGKICELLYKNDHEHEKDRMETTLMKLCHKTDKPKPQRG